MSREQLDKTVQTVQCGRVLNDCTDGWKMTDYTDGWKKISQPIDYWKITNVAADGEHERSV